MWDHGVGFAIWQVGCHISRIFNFLMGGSLEETFSFRVAKEGDGQCPVCTFFCNLLHKVDPYHCRDSVAWWRENGVAYIPEHRPLWPWFVIWIGVIGLILWFKPFGLL